MVQRRAELCRAVRCARALRCCGLEHSVAKPSGLAELILQTCLAQLADALRELANRKIGRALAQLSEKTVDVVEEPIVLPDGQLQEIAQDAGAFNVGLDAEQILLFALAEVIAEVATGVVDMSPTRSESTSHAARSNRWCAGFFRGRSRTPCSQSSSSQSSTSRARPSSPPGGGGPRANVGKAGSR